MFLVPLSLIMWLTCLHCYCSWKANTWVELAHVRYPPVGQPAADINVQPGANVEVRAGLSALDDTPLLFILFHSSDHPQALLPHHNNEPAGWWMGTLVKSKGEVRHIIKVQREYKKYPPLCEGVLPRDQFSRNQLPRD